jgi:two-component sensor histidine kinase
MEDQEDAGRVDAILATPGLADALESDRFKQFLDHVPVAIAVSELHPSEVVTYANIEFERLVGQSAADIERRSWTGLPGIAEAADDARSLGEAVAGSEQYLGRFTLAGADGTAREIDAWSNLIEDDDGTPMFRLVVLAEFGADRRANESDLAQQLLDKDVMLLELQHRVKNNLQMITALIRLEARNVPDGETGARFERLGGRINALALLYDAMAAKGLEETVDLGSYLSQIATAVMAAHAIEGIRLDLKVDSWPVSINVAMPAGLVVNELLTNALKHAFDGRERGTITLHSLIDDSGCRVMISDDGNGLPEGATWPKAGKLGAVIAQSLRQNAKAQMDVVSVPGEGVTVSIFFARAAAAAA